MSARKEEPTVPGASKFDPDLCGWTIEALIGYTYSTSVLSRLALGDLAGEFEEDVRRRLGEQAAEGKLRETVDFGYELARRTR